MARNWLLAIVITGCIASISSAQSPIFKWRSGQVLTYKVAQATDVVETVGEQTMSTSTKLDLVKRWQVSDVDEKGWATLQMTLVSLRMEIKTPKGDVIVYDSANTAKSDPELRQQMGQYVGPPLTVVRFDPRGQIGEVKESKFGPASRLQCDLPFKVVLPTTTPAVNQSWERNYEIKMDPPQGAGESYTASQTYTCKNVTNNIVTIHVATAIKNPPEAAADKLPLLPLMREGDLQFDVGAGLLRAVRYQFSQELPNHRGEGSKYQFKDTYSEDLVESR